MGSSSWPAASSHICITSSRAAFFKRQRTGASFNPYVYSYLNEICDHTFHKERWARRGLD